MPLRKIDSAIQALESVAQSASHFAAYSECDQKRSVGKAVVDAIQMLNEAKPSIQELKSENNRLNQIVRWVCAVNPEMAHLINDHDRWDK